MNDRALRLALEALLDEPALKSAHRASIERGLADLRAQRLTATDRDYLCYLIEHYNQPKQPTDPVDALIAAFQDKLPNHDPTAVATAIQHALSQQPATLNGAPVTIRMDGDTHAHQANLAIGNQVGGNLVQVTVTIPIPDACFDALLANALRTHKHEKTRERIINAAQQIESDRLLNLRLQGFVGRINELAAIREHIATMRTTGGYVLIKAAAGEGKSSTIAKLIQEAGITKTPHHFIALTTGREYQLGLLRAVVAQLILKHNLIVSYFPEASYPAMKAEFMRILDELAKQEIHETIYLDGLDQLQPEIDGSRDLSFLPPQPPPGIVIVLGSRPDETLKPLEILHRIDYNLPPLHEGDALVLWRLVQPGIVDGLLHDLYAALKGNALFVHLAADTMQGQSVVDATSLIRKIEQNPSNLFGITLDRIKGRSRAQWDVVWKPMLALLLVAQEPLWLDVLRDLLEKDHDTMQDAVWVLGGLVSQGIDQRVALHHLLFRDYLTASVFNDREVKRWHQRLADWCGADLDAIWTDHHDALEQARRVYARHHYVTHLALAENWTMLWQVLDTGDYGEYKTRFDPSTRLYALDLDRGRESAVNAGQSLEEHLQNLPRLWKYSLLRTSLTSRIDQWPDDLFVVLAMLGRTQEALERIEMVSDPIRQLRIWEKIVQWCNPQQQHTIIVRMQQYESQSLTLINKPTKYILALILIARTAALLGHRNYAVKILDDASAIVQNLDEPIRNQEILITFIQPTVSFSYFIQNIDMANIAVSGILEGQTLPLLALAHTSLFIGDRERSLILFDRAINTAANSDIQIRIIALAILVRSAALLYNKDQAIKFLNDINAMISIIQVGMVRTTALAFLAQAAALLNDNNQAFRLLEKAIDTIVSNEPDTILLYFSAITQAFVLIGNEELVLKLMNKTTIIVSSMRDELLKTLLLIQLAQVAVLFNDRDQAIKLLDQDSVSDQHLIKNMIDLALALGELDQSISMAKHIDDAREQIDAFALIARSYTSQGKYDRAVEILDYIITTISIDNDEDRSQYLNKLSQIALTIGNFDQAISIAKDIKWKTDYDFISIVETAAKTIASLGDFDRAISIAEEVNDERRRAQALVSIAQTAVSLRQSDQAIALCGRAISLAEEVNNKWIRDDVLVSIIQVVTSLGDFDRAICIAEEVNDKRSRAQALVSIIQAVTSLGDFDQAISIAKEVNDKRRRAHAIVSIAQAAALLGESTRAIALCDLGISIAEDINDRWMRADVLASIAQLAALLGDSARAIMLCELAISIAKDFDKENEWKHDYEFLSVTQTIVKTAVSIGDFDRAISIAEDINDKRMRDDVLVSIAQQAASVGDFDRAIVITKDINDEQRRAAVFISIVQADKMADTLIDKPDQIIAIGISMNVLHIRTVLIEIIQSVQSYTISIPFIQKEWQSDKIRSTMLNSLIFITSLIQDYPWFGSAILEGEEWVNKQLKRLG